MYVWVWDGDADGRDCSADATTTFDCFSIAFEHRSLCLISPGKGPGVEAVATHHASTNQFGYFQKAEATLHCFGGWLQVGCEETAIVSHDYDSRHQKINHGWENCMHRHALWPGRSASTSLEFWPIIENHNYSRQPRLGCMRQPRVAIPSGDNR